MKRTDRALFWHFLLVLLPLAALVTGSAYLIGQAQTRQEIERLRLGESARIELGAEEILRTLRKVPAHIRSLQRETTVRAAIDDPRPQNLVSVQGAFTTLLQRNPEYDQARWIDETGLERVRVNRASDDISVEVVSDAGLQNKSDRGYFRNSVSLPLDQVFISRLDLNVDNGQISNPYRPTIRFAIPVAGKDGRRRGILIINYLAKPLLDGFLDVTGRADRHISLLDQEGYWLSSPNRDDEWAFMFNRPVTMGARHPEIWPRLLRDPTGQYVADSGLWSWRKLSLQDAESQLGPVLGPSWFVVSHIESPVIQAIHAKIWQPIAGGAALLILAFAVLSWALATRTQRERVALEERIKAEAEATESRARMAALEQAQAAGAKLAAIVDSSQDAIISKDLNSVITSWNAGAEQLFGYTASEAIGQNIIMLIPPERQHEEKEIIRQIVGGAVVDHFETLRRHKDGHLIDISATISPIRDAVGKIVGASKIARDITQAKRIEAELRRYREHLEEVVEERTAQIAEAAKKLRERDTLITAVTDNIPGVVSYWDKNLCCRFANRGFMDWFGKDPRNLVGRRMAEIFDSSDMETGLAMREAALRGEGQYFIREVRKVDGETGFLSVHYIPDATNGEVIGFFVLAIDITRQKQAEEGLRLLNSRLTDALASAQEANQAKSQFLANMSHEIRTPMNGVIGMLELLEYTPLDTEQARMIGTINSSAQSLLQIINDILDFSKIEAGQLKIELVEADVARIVESTARLFLGAAAAKGIIMRCFIAPVIRNPMLIDPVRLRQILSNLVSNAIKFTSRGGVTIALDTQAHEGEKELLRFSVADTGIGISPEAQARLFQPFTQADDSTARKFGGTGLGLSICRRLVDLMGGEIRLTSREGEGTEVVLTLPARRLHANAGSRDMPDTGSFDLRDVGVGLLIDDETEYRYFEAYLAYWGAVTTRLTAEASAIRDWLADSVQVVLAPLEPGLGQRILFADAGANQADKVTRYVYYSHDDLPEDQVLGSDSILTTAISRARIVTAVAVATGRKSPEVEMQSGLGQLPTKAVPPSRDAAIAAGRLILLAEDHPVNREVILRQLRFLGYAVDAVEDGAQALAALAKTRYGLLLTDCNMPVMDGFALTEAIRRLEKPGNRLPIVALTANALQGEDKRCIAAGMDDYLSKPVELERLRKRLERWLSPAAPAAVSIPPAQAEKAAHPNDAVFDLALLSEYCGDDPEAMRETLGLYVESLKSDLASLLAAIGRKDAEGAEMYAHRIKGAARAVGGQAIVEYSERAEHAAHARSWSTMDLLVVPLGEAVEEIDRVFLTKVESGDWGFPQSAAG
jgi:PAS domain S-box-containing protein